MLIGITMLKVLRGHEFEAYRFVLKAKGVIKVYRLLGEFSLFVVVQAENKVALYLIIDTIKESSYVTSVWHILVSKEDPSVKEGSIMPITNCRGKSENRNSIEYCAEVPQLHGKNRANSPFIGEAVQRS
jgi:hypothetical protein